MKKIIKLFLLIIGIAVTINVKAVDVSTFDELKNAIENASSNESINITNDITVNNTILINDKNITITSNNNIKLTRDASFLKEFFNINSNSKVEIKNIIMEGNAISFEPDIDNASEISGGYYNVPIKNSDNDQKSQAPIIVSSGSLTFDNVTIQNNYNNSSYGGALRQSNGTLTINNSNFIHNLSQYGGSLYISGVSELKINNTKFENNFAYKENSVCDGGGIYLTGVSNVIVTNNEFNNNTVSRDNGGAMVIHLNNAASNNYIFSNNKYIGNTIGNDGSSIHFRGYGNNGKSVNTNIYFTNELFKDNVGLAPSQSVGTVGIIGTDGAEMYFEQCDFDGNTQIFGDHGSDDYIKFEDCNFVKNSGTILVRASSYDFINCNIKNNKDTLIFVGASQINEDSAPYINIEKCNFENNESTNYGIIAIITDAAFKEQKKYTININDSTFKENSASTGAAITIRDGHTVNIKNSKFISNNSTTLGGAIAADTQSIIKISSTYFSENIAERQGGAVYCYQCDIDIKESIFENNKSPNGGAVLFGDTVKSLIVDTKFIKNSASKINNYGYGYGGALYLSNDTGNYTNCTIIENSAAYYGGAVYVAGTSSFPTFNNTLIKDNTAAYAGGIMLIAGGADLSNTLIYDNEASTQGDDIRRNNNVKLLLPDVVKQDIILKSGYKAMGIYYDGYLRNSDGSTVTTRWNPISYANLTETNEVTLASGLKVAYALTFEIDASVILKGKNLKENEFEYTLTSLDDDVEFTSTNKEDGSIELKISTKENKDGDYLYLLKQEKGNEKGIKYSSEEYYVLVKVENGEIKKEYYKDKKLKERVKKLEFVNEYSEEQAKIEEVKNTENNPKTIDHIKVLAMMLLISLAALIELIILKRKNA